MSCSLVFPSQRHVSGCLYLYNKDETEKTFIPIIITSIYIVDELVTSIGIGQSWPSVVSATSPALVGVVISSSLYVSRGLPSEATQQFCI